MTLRIERRGLDASGFQRPFRNERCNSFCQQSLGDTYLVLAADLASSRPTDRHFDLGGLWPAKPAPPLISNPIRRCEIEDEVEHLTDGNRQDSLPLSNWD